MKVKTLSALAGIGTTMILSGQADASFLGLRVVKQTTVLVGTDATLKDVYRVYADFTPGDLTTVQAVFGDATHALTITSRNALNTGLGTAFFNGPLDNCPVGTAYTAPTPAQLWSSFASIGAWVLGPLAPVGGAVQTSNTFGADPLNVIQFINGNSLSNNNISWFLSGDPIQSRASTLTDGDALGVGLMQLTVQAGENVAGTISLQINPNGPLAGAASQLFNLTFNSFLVPAPGALALLGLAGLVGTRRRRA